MSLRKLRKWFWSEQFEGVLFLIIGLGLLGYALGSRAVLAGIGSVFILKGANKL